MHGPLFANTEIREAESLEEADLSVVEMMQMLQRIHDSVRYDSCLEDLAQPVRAILNELRARRRLARVVAMQADASAQSYEN